MKILCIWVDLCSISFSFYIPIQYIFHAFLKNYLRWLLYNDYKLWVNSYEQLYVTPSSLKMKSREWQISYLGHENAQQEIQFKTHFWAGGEWPEGSALGWASGWVRAAIVPSADETEPTEAQTGGGVAGGPSPRARSWSGWLSPDLEPVAMEGKGLWLTFSASVPIIDAEQRRQRIQRAWTLRIHPWPAGEHVEFNATWGQ